MPDAPPYCKRVAIEVGVLGPTLSQLTGAGAEPTALRALVEIEIKITAAAALCFCARSNQPPIADPITRAYFKHDTRTG